MKKIYRLLVISFIALCTLHSSFAGETENKPDTKKVRKVFMVKNENGFLVPLQEADLDIPPKYTILGIPKKVVFNHKILPVEIMLIIDGDRITSIDRFTPTGDTDD